MKIFGKDVDSPLVIGGVTVVSYICVIFYQAGKLSVYRVPASYIDANITSIVEAWALMIAYLFLTIFLASMIAAVVLKLNNLISIVLPNRIGPRFQRLQK